MKRLAVTVLILGSCTALTPQQEAERDFRRARMTDDVRRKLELLDRAIEIHPTAEAHLERALLSETAREPSRALADLTAAIEFLRDQPARATLLLGRAVLLGNARRYAEAEADLAEVIR